MMLSGRRCLIFSTEVDRAFSFGSAPEAPLLTAWLAGNYVNLCVHVVTPAADALPGIFIRKRLKHTDHVVVAEQ